MIDCMHNESSYIWHIYGFREWTTTCNEHAYMHGRDCRSDWWSYIIDVSLISFS